jgi:hypothetical protein
LSPWRGRRASFPRPDELPEPPAPVPSIGPVVFSLAFDGRSRVVDLSGLPCQRLVRTMAAQLARIGGQDGTVREWGGFRQMLGHLRAFATFIASTEPARAARLGLEDLEPGLLESFEAHVAAGYPSTSGEPHLFMRTVTRLLRLAGEAQPGSLSLEMQARACFASTRSFRPRPRPLDAYPPGVLEIIEAAALADVGLVRDRIMAGEHLAASGADPEVGGWSSLANVLHHVAERGPLTAAEHGRIPEVAKTHGGTRAVNRHLFLTAADLVPFVVLLITQTGMEPECVKGLRADCLVNPARGFVSISYVKKRARNASHKALRARDGGLRSPGGVVRLALRLTARGRERAGGDLLWADVRDDGVHASFGTGGSFDRRVGEWAASHGLHDLVDRGGGPVRLDLRRLRKTYKSRQYVRVAGVLDDFATGHSKEVAAAHYADIDAHRELHEQAVEAGLRQALEVGLGAPVVAEEDGRPLRDGRPLSPSQARAASSADADVFLASCSDFFASPFSRSPGSGCPVAIWGCLECPNAVYTSRHLPSLLSFAGFMNAQREELAAEEWQARFGLASERIATGILPHFTAEQVAAARQVADDNDGRLSLPARFLESTT